MLLPGWIKTLTQDTLDKSLIQFNWNIEVLSKWGNRVFCSTVWTGNYTLNLKPCQCFYQAFALNHSLRCEWFIRFLTGSLTMAHEVNCFHLLKVWHATKMHAAC